MFWTGICWQTVSSHFTWNESFSHSPVITCPLKIVLTVGKGSKWKNLNAKTSISRFSLECRDFYEIFIEVFNLLLKLLTWFGNVFSNSCRNKHKTPKPNQTKNPQQAKENLQTETKKNQPSIVVCIWLLT